MNSIESSFSKSANTYDNSSDVQKQIADKLVETLPKNLRPKNIIDLGTGTGYLAQEIIKHFPQAEITLCDISNEMLKVASSKIPSAKLLCSDFENLNNVDNYDLVISSAALHWANSFEEVLKNISCQTLAVSLMLDGTLFELRSIREEIAPNKKAKPELRAFDYYSKIIERNFKIINAVELSYSQYYSTVEQAMDSLRKTGVNGGNTEKLNKEEYHKLIEIYSSRYNSEKGYPLTFKAGFFIANKIAQGCSLDTQSV